MHKQWFWPFILIVTFSGLAGCNETSEKHKEKAAAISKPETVAVQSQAKPKSQPEKAKVNAIQRCDIGSQKIELSKKEISREFTDGSAVFVEYLEIKALPGCETVALLNKNFSQKAEEEIAGMGVSGGKTERRSTKKHSKVEAEESDGAYIHELDFYLFQDSILSIYHHGFDRFSDENKTIPFMGAENYDLATGEFLTFYGLFEKDVQATIRQYAAPVFREQYKYSTIPNYWQLTLDKSVEEPEFYLSAGEITVLLSTDEVFQLTREPYFQIKIPLSEVKQFLKK